MPGRPRSLAIEADRRFPVRVRVEVPPDGFGSRLDCMHAWLDATCGADGWATAPAGIRGVVNDAVAFYFRDATLAAAFVARWCAPLGEADGTFRVREGEPKPRIAGRPHG